TSVVVIQPLPIPSSLSAATVPIRGASRVARWRGGAFPRTQGSDPAEPTDAERLVRSAACVGVSCDGRPSNGSGSCRPETPFPRPPGGGDPGRVRGRSGSDLGGLTLFFWSFGRGCRCACAASGSRLAGGHPVRGLALTPASCARSCSGRKAGGLLSGSVGWGG